MQEENLLNFSKIPLKILVFLSKSIYLSSEFNPAAFFVNANMVRIPEPLVVVFLYTRIPVSRTGKGMTFGKSVV